MPTIRSTDENETPDVVFLYEPKKLKSKESNKDNNFSGQKRVRVPRDDQNFDLPECGSKDCDFQILQCLIDHRSTSEACK
ncbi:hypothetical protein CEXT_753811 [Caerostris extrusa]|uniref:Uncharacterized protein n=1 Tax=Caerostris extrusa TaxID=172846 RepID=A0AAV4VLF5_CAEEX|nr:hypothetical protein CEXT_753811 [Caerostris extrusa]